ERVVDVADLGRRWFLGGERLPVAACLVAAPLVEQPARTGLDQPGTRVVRQTVGWPVLGRRDQRLLGRVFAVGEVTEAAREGADDGRRTVAQRLLDAGGV